MQPRRCPLQRSEVFREALRWNETPFLHQHRILGHGVDCWNLIRAPGEACGVLSIDEELFAPFAAYGLQPSPRQVLGVLSTFLRPVTGEPMLADVACIAWRPNLPMHMAILGEHEGRPTLLHASSKFGKVVHHGFVAEWPRLVHSWWRYPGLADG